MQKTGVANLPLHPGRAPRWLFDRMVRLSEAIIDVMLIEYGVDDVLKRFCNPFWFQAFSCVLGFDWHSSGTTTVTCGALKEAIDPERHGICVAGGKGKTSRKTPEEIERFGDIFSLSTNEIERLQYASRMAAKVDNAALQDGYNLYHHVFIFSEKGRWVVIQQGMNDLNNYARRYHWLSENVKSFVVEPHNAIVGDRKEQKVLDMTSRENEDIRKASVDLVKDHPNSVSRMLNSMGKQLTLDNFAKDRRGDNILTMPRSINWSLMKRLYDFQPRNYEELLSLRGVGPKTIRALALISELVYGTKPSWKDPVKFTFAVGGKDGVPYPVDRKVMDETIDILKRSIEEARIGKEEKVKALKRMRRFIPVRE
ncbi:MAG TPA: DUF763 domain-containing protein [Thermoplasmatales archaeon]|nr:DUF763 domain-containing protein [Thermoplasmatales archaeon]